MMHIRNSLPDTIKVQRVEERLSGTVLAIHCTPIRAMLTANGQRWAM